MAFFHRFTLLRQKPRRRAFTFINPNPSPAVIGVAATGAVGTVVPSVAVNTGGITGAAGTGVAGGVPMPSVTLAGVFGTGRAHDVFPIPPPPAHRPPLFIPQDSLGTPASIWLGS